MIILLKSKKTFTQFIKVYLKSADPMDILFQNPQSFMNFLFNKTSYLFFNWFL